MGEGRSGSKNESAGKCYHYVGHAFGSGAQTRMSSKQCLKPEICASPALTCVRGRGQGCSTQRRRLSIHELSEEVRRHLSEAAHPSNSGAKFALSAALHHWEHHHRLCAFATVHAAGSFTANFAPEFEAAAAAAWWRRTW